MGGCVPQPLCRSVIPSSSICLLVFDEPMRLGWQDSRVYTGCTDAFPSVFIDKLLDGDLLLICLERSGGPGSQRSKWQGMVLC